MINPNVGGVGPAVGVGGSVGLGLGEGLGDGLGLGEGLGLGDCVGLGLEVGVGLGLEVGVGSGVSSAAAVMEATATRVERGDAFGDSVVTAGTPNMLASKVSTTTASAATPTSASQSFLALGVRERRSAPRRMTPARLWP